MNLDLLPEDVAFRDEVRAFLQSALTDELREVARKTAAIYPDREWNLKWQRILYEKGWAAPSWPVEYGGTGWSVMQRHIFASECARAEAPALAPNGLRMVAPMLMHYGTAEQKAHYIPRILSGEDYWAQGYSEPGSGSDLASLSLKAESDGDDYVLNGSKIWTTHAQFSNRMFALVRTDATGKKQYGISFLLLDMASPGIEIRPLITLAGDHEVNQVFFTDVRVPKANRVGVENEGWAVAKYLLEFERGGAYSAGLKVALENLRKVAAQEPGGGGAPLLADESFARKLAEAEIELDAIEFTEHRIMAALSEGQNPGAASSTLKMRGTEAKQHISTLAMEIAAYYGMVDQKPAREPGANIEVIGPAAHLIATARYLNDRAASIYGGSNEIQRNIVAGAILGIR